MGYAIQNITALPLGTIIGSPLKAAIEAQTLAAKSTVDFIHEVGFKPADVDEDPFFSEEEGEIKDADMGELRNVTFKYSLVEPDANGNTEATLTVPILTIVPIPYLRIDEMTIDFMAKITEEITQTKTKSTEGTKKGDAGAKAGWGPCSVGAAGTYSSKHSSTSARNSRYQTELTMNIHVRAVQDDIPAGLGRVLSLLEGIIKEVRSTSDSKSDSESGSETRTPLRRTPLRTTPA